MDHDDLSLVRTAYLLFSNIVEQLPNIKWNIITEDPATYPPSGVLLFIHQIGKWDGKTSCGYALRADPENYPNHVSFITHYYGHSWTTIQVGDKWAMIPDELNTFN